MSNTLKNNAFHILGLDCSASQKEVLKRSKEIINHLKIDDYPEYDLDIGVFNKFRTEESVKEALQKLQNPKKKIKEYFFWLQIADDTDEKALSALKKKDYVKAINIWEKSSMGATSKSLFYKKNLAILYSILLLSSENNKEFLSASIKCWQEIINNKKFWTSFNKIYKLHDELSIRPEFLDEFQEKIVILLADIYSEMYQAHKDPDYINEFQKCFGAKGEKIEKNVLEPIYKALSDAIEKLENLNISEDEIFDENESKAIKNLVKSIQIELNKLIDLGLYEDSRTKVMRDKTANALLKIVLDLNNDLNESEAALGLIKIATNISGTESFKMKIENNLKIIQNNVDFQKNEDYHAKILDPIIAKIKNGDFEQALNLINHHLDQPLSDDALIEILTKFKKSLEERIAVHGKPIQSAPTLFAINGCGTMMYGDTLYFTILWIPIMAISRYSVTYVQGGKYNFHGKLELRPAQKFWRWFIIVLVVLLFIINA